MSQPIFAFGRNRSANKRTTSKGGVVIAAAEDDSVVVINSNKMHGNHNENDTSINNTEIHNEKQPEPQNEEQQQQQQSLHHYVDKKSSIASDQDPFSNIDGQSNEGRILHSQQPAMSISIEDNIDIAAVSTAGDEEDEILYIQQQPDDAKQDTVENAAEAGWCGAMNGDDISKIFSQTEDITTSHANPESAGVAHATDAADAADAAEAAEMFADAADAAAMNTKNTTKDHAFVPEQDLALGGIGVLECRDDNPDEQLRNPPVGGGELMAETANIDLPIPGNDELHIGSPSGIKPDAEQTHRYVPTRPLLSPYRDNAVYHNPIIDTASESTADTSNSPVMLSPPTVFKQKVLQKIEQKRSKIIDETGAPPTEPLPEERLYSNHFTEDDAACGGLQCSAAASIFGQKRGLKPIGLNKKFAKKYSNLSFGSKSTPNGGKNDLVDINDKNEALIEDNDYNHNDNDDVHSRHGGYVPVLIDMASRSISQLTTAMAADPQHPLSSSKTKTVNRDLQAAEADDDYTNMSMMYDPKSVHDYLNRGIKDASSFPDPNIKKGRRGRGFFCFSFGSSGDDVAGNNNNNNNNNNEDDDGSATSSFYEAVKTKIPNSNASTTCWGRFNQMFVSTGLIYFLVFLITALGLLYGVLSEKFHWLDGNSTFNSLFHFNKRINWDKQISVAFVGNAYLFINDMPRVMEAVSTQHITQQSCIHAGGSLADLYKTGNGMYKLWHTEEAIITTQYDPNPASADAVEDNQYDDHYFNETNNSAKSWYDSSSAYEVAEPSYLTIYDYGMCTVPQMFQQGYDENISYENPANVYYNDGLNPCIVDPYYADYIANETQRRTGGFIPSTWDYVVLADQTKRMAVPEARNSTVSILTNGFGPLLTSMSKVPVPVIVDTHAFWSTNSNMSGLVDIPTFTNLIYDGVADYIDALKSVNVTSRKKQLHPIVAPIGLAYLTIWEENYDLWETLFIDDKIHPSIRGSYLFACVLYSTLFGHLPDPTVVATTTENIPLLFMNSRKLLQTSSSSASASTAATTTEDEMMYMLDVAYRVAVKGYVPSSFYSSSIDNGAADDDGRRRRRIQVVQEQTHSRRRNIRRQQRRMR